MHYDLITIGAGTAGLTVADVAPRLGLKALLIEKNRVGGDCTWTGCVPSKALLKVAKVAYHARTAAEYGIHTSEPQVDMANVRNYVQSTIQHIYHHETPEVIRESGVEVLLGAARFVDPHTVEVDGERYTADQFLITAGASPFIPPIEGIDEVPFVTYEQIFDNDRLPEHLLVVGAGPIGSEMGQAYRRLGAEVTMIDEAFMPAQTEDVRQTMLKVFRREGVRFVEGLVASATHHDGEITLTLQSGEKIHGDMLLLATGRRPNVHNLGLEDAGVDFDKHGITVDKHLRTSQRHIFAAGDVTGGPQFTHYAGWQAFQALRNALLPIKDQGHIANVPHVTFTDPEVAHAGLTEAEARAKFGDDVQVAHMANTEIDRAITDNDLDGFVKVVHKPNGEILGATIVADRAGDAIIEFILAMEEGIKFDGLPTAIHPYPTLATGIQLMAADFTANKLLGGALGTVVKVLLGTNGANRS